MSISEIMAQYKETKNKLTTVEAQFNNFKNMFEKDFEPEITAIERSRIERAEMEAMKTVQQEQQRRATTQSSKTDKGPPIGGNVDVSLREVKHDPESTPSPVGADKPAPAKMTRKQPKNTPFPEPAPETAVAAKPPKLGDKLSKLYRKLCKRYHPDMCNNDDDFLKVQESYEKGDNMTMIEMAIQCDIPIETYVDNKDELINYWSLEIQRMEQEIYNLTHMLPWVWCMANPQKKTDLRPTVLNHLKNNIGN